MDCKKTYFRVIFQKFLGPKVKILNISLHRGRGETDHTPLAGTKNIKRITCLGFFCLKRLKTWPRLESLRPINICLLQRQMTLGCRRLLLTPDYLLVIQSVHFKDFSISREWPKFHFSQLDSSCNAVDIYNFETHQQSNGDCIHFSICAYVI